MTTGQFTFFEPGTAIADYIGGAKPNHRSVRVEPFLYRFGSQATLSVVEWFPGEDGTPRKRIRSLLWPGL
jgi:hypothetical protein